MTRQKNFSEVYDYYQAAVYERDVLADAVLELLTLHSCATVLDAACGTGLPALDLRARGVSVECSDADPQMLVEFRRNARLQGVSDECVECRWLELGKWERKFQYVMCRGNSLVYATSWGDNSDTAADFKILEDNLKAISSVVAPGGYLHIDAPRSSELSEKTYPAIEFRNKVVVVTERVTLQGNSRRWDLRVSIGDEVFSFLRNSSNICANDFEKILIKIGFSSIEHIHLQGERPSYSVLLARR